MEKISLLIGKPVVSIFDGNLEGYVLSVLFDKKMNKLQWIVFFDDETQEEKIVEAKSIYRIGQDAIMTKNTQNILLMDTLQDGGINIIGYSFFDIKGKLLNKISDVEIDENYKCKSIILKDNTSINQSEILSIGKSVVIKKDAKVKLSNFCPKVRIRSTKKDEQINVQIQEKPENISTVVNPIPKKILTSNYNFLIGRKLGKNIYSDAGNLIAKINTKITSQTIDFASKNGKLRDLTVCSIA